MAIDTATRIVSTDAKEIAYDILIQDGGRDFLYTPIVNYANYDMTAPEAMLPAQVKRPMRSP